MGEIVTEEIILFKVLYALKRSGLSKDQATNAIREMQNAGILFRELGND
jgi:hypothetical protein